MDTIVLYMCFNIWPKIHSTAGQQSTVSQTRCLFLFYLFSLHDPATPYTIELDKLIYNWHVVKDQDQDSLLVKRRNDNHSPGPVIRELVPSSHQRSELSNTILCIFSG